MYQSALGNQEEMIQLVHYVLVSTDISVLGNQPILEKYILKLTHKKKLIDLTEN